MIDSIMQILTSLTGWLVTHPTVAGFAVRFSSGQINWRDCLDHRRQVFVEATRLSYRVWLSAKLVEIASVFRTEASSKPGYDAEVCPTDAS